jgi:predicted RNA-binding Zn ribbon-like protein
LASTTTGNQYAIRESVAALAHVRRTAATVALAAARTATADRAAVVTASRLGARSTDEDREPLSGSHRNFRVDAPTVTALTASASAVCRDGDRGHIFGHDEGLRCAGELKPL